MFLTLDRRGGLNNIVLMECKVSKSIALSEGVRDYVLELSV